MKKDEQHRFRYESIISSSRPATCQKSCLASLNSEPLKLVSQCCSLHPWAVVLREWRLPKWTSNILPEPILFLWYHWCVLGSTFFPLWGGECNVLSFCSVVAWKKQVPTAFRRGRRTGKPRQGTTRCLGSGCEETGQELMHLVGVMGYPNGTLASIQVNLSIFPLLFLKRLICLRRFFS